MKPNLAEAVANFRTRIGHPDPLFEHTKHLTAPKQLAVAWEIRLRAAIGPEVLSDAQRATLQSIEERAFALLSDRLLTENVGAEEFLTETSVLHPDYQLRLAQCIIADLGGRASADPTTPERTVLKRLEQSARKLKRRTCNEVRNQYYLDTDGGE